jgi:hypothetical protein
LCDLYVTVPNSSWGKLQRGIGGAAGILPATLPGVIVALSEVDVALGDELDGTAPMYGVAAGDPADPAFALAIKLVDPRRARGLFAEGDTARYTGKQAAGMTLLVPNRASPRDHRFEVAITNNGYLLMGKTAADLTRLGPYTTRTLPSRPLPAESAAALDVPRSALQTLLKPKLESLWKEGKAFLLAQDERMRAERGGRAPDFGDPAAIIAALDAVLSPRVAIVGDLDHVRVALDIVDDAAVLTATLAPASGPANEARNWIDSMKLGDAAPVLSLPAATALAFSTRDGEPERVEQAKTLERAIASSLGPRLKDPGKLHDVVEAMTKARDDSFALALDLDEPSGLLLRFPVRDANAQNKAIRGVFDLTRAEPFKDILHVRDVKSATELLPGLGKVDVLTLVRGDAPKPGARSNAGGPRRAAPDAGAPPGKPPAGFGAAWAIDHNALALALGPEPVVTLKINGKPDKRLADEPALRRFTTALGSNASTIIIGQPLRLDPKRANLPTAPLGIGVGKKGSDAFVRVDIPTGLLREAVRWQMGF